MREVQGGIPVRVVVQAALAGHAEAGRRRNHVCVGLQGIVRATGVSYDRKWHRLRLGAEPFKECRRIMVCLLLLLVDAIRRKSVAMSACLVNPSLVVRR